MAALLKVVGEAAKRKREEPKVAHLTAEDDIEAYLTTFERTMEAFEIPASAWSFRLAPQLTGKAQKAFAAMDKADTCDYTKVRSAILTRYDITTDIPHPVQKCDKGRR